MSFSTPIDKDGKAFEEWKYFIEEVHGDMKSIYHLYRHCPLRNEDNRVHIIKFLFSIRKYKVFEYSTSSSFPGEFVHDSYYQCLTKPGIKLK